MKQVCKSIGYWCLLIFCFTIGILLVGAFLLLWSMEVNFAFSLENIFGLTTGIIFLAMSFLFYENRIYFPLRRTSHKKNQSATDKIQDTFHPIKYELNTNLHGLPVTHTCGAPSFIRLRATQINPHSDNQEKDYEKPFITP